MGLNGSWVKEYTDATAYQISGNRIGMLTPGGALYVGSHPDGPYSSWEKRS